MRSPRPDRPVNVSARAPKALPKRTISAKPRVVSAADALAPNPRPVTMPDAIASTFFTAPVLLEMAHAKDIDMPISTAVAAVLAGKLSVDEAIAALLTRPIKAEE